MKTAVFLFAAILVIGNGSLFAQKKDSLQIQVGVITTVATKSYQPLWLVANRHGVIADRGNDLASHIRLTNEHCLGSGRSADSTASPNKHLRLQYGFDLYNNNHFRDFVIKESFLKFVLKNWQLQGGRFVETIGEVDPLLSSGSFGVSGNALPIPQIGIKLNDFTPLPFAKGSLQVKGQFAHGWFGNNNYVKGSFLHQKSFYLRAGRERFSAYVGLSHFAQWGGHHPRGALPGRFKDYLRIVVAASGDPTDPVYQQGPRDITNAVGNHVLIPDLGITLKTKSATLRLYTQTIFDKGQADSANQRDKLDDLRMLSRDRLLGFSWESSKQSPVTKIVVESIYTKYQGGPVIYYGRDNYYNNATYATGWQYNNRILGTPLFINREEASHYRLDSSVQKGWSIVSNRVQGIHIGVKGRVSQKLDYRFLATSLVQYGNYYNDAFAEGKKQNHVLLEAAYRLNSSVELRAAIGQDFGQLSNNTGGLFALEWKLAGSARELDN